MEGTVEQKKPTTSDAQESKPTPGPNLADSDGNSKSKVQNITYQLREWKRSYRRSFEYYIEEPSFIILFLLIAYVDTILGSCQLSGASSSDFAGKAIESVRNAILSLQCFELLLQIGIFRVRFFAHWGYAFDTVLVASRLLDKCSFLAADDRHLHLASFARVWRFVRVVEIEASRHDRTKGELSSRTESAREWERKATSIREDFERERRLSRQNQDAARGCREEIETLREALEIAALDVAAATKGRYDPNQTGSEVGIDDVTYDDIGGDNGDIKAWGTHPLGVDSFTEGMR